MIASLDPSASSALEIPGQRLPLGACSGPLAPAGGDSPARPSASAAARAEQPGRGRCGHCGVRGFDSGACPECGDREGQPPEAARRPPRSPKVVLVCGGRNWCDYRLTADVLEAVAPTVVVHGAARGADAMAGRWARENGVEERPYPANWRLHGRGAGFRRNQQMLDVEQPALVVAFPGGNGTADMVRRANARGVRVLSVESSPGRSARAAQPESGDIRCGHCGVRGFDVPSCPECGTTVPATLAAEVCR
jgi:hypothetical protein